MNKMQLNPALIKLMVLILGAGTLLFAILALVQGQALALKQQHLKQEETKLRAELRFLEQSLNGQGVNTVSPIFGNAAQVYDFFSSSANRSAMSLVKLAVKPGADPNQFVLELTAEGNYSRLLVFLRYLTSSRYNLSIKKMELHAAAKKPDNSLRLVLSATMPLGRGAQP